MFVADEARGHVVGRDHAVFGNVEEMVEQMLVPYRGMSGGETAYTASEQVHVKESYLGPGIEGRRESKG